MVDLWTGRDAIGGRPHTGDSISILMSVSKGMTATCVHLLGQRGLLDVDASVARYWPEFAGNGKQRVTVRHVLTHSAGLFGFPVEAHIGPRELLDWDRCVTVLAQMAPLWEPGTAFAYHSLTFGFLLGEVVHRIAGRTVGQFFAEEIAKPLSLDLWIGLPETEEGRVADQFSSLPEATPQQSRDQLQALGIDVANPVVATLLVSSSLGGQEAMRVLNSRDGHAAEVPSANGIGNARSLARLYAGLVGEVDGVRLLHPDTVERVRVAQTDGMTGPEPLAAIPQPFPLRFALGYEAPRTGSPLLGEPRGPHRQHRAGRRDWRQAGLPGRATGFDLRPHRRADDRHLAAGNRLHLVLCRGVPLACTEPDPHQRRRAGPSIRAAGVHAEHNPVFPAAGRREHRPGYGPPPDPGRFRQRGSGGHSGRPD